MPTHKHVAAVQAEIKKTKTPTSPRVKKRPTKPPHQLTPEDHLRTSERLALNRCRQRWDWGYGMKLEPKREAPALRFGTLIHLALEIYYSPANQKRKRPLHPADIFLRIYDEELARTRKEWNAWRDEDDTWHEYRELGEIMLTGYVDHWTAAATHNDAEYVTLATEQRFRMPILIPPGQPPLHPMAPTQYVGTLDRILIHLPTRRLLFGDYKTTKNDPTKVTHLALDEQAGAYYAYAPTWIRDYAPPALRRAIHAAAERLPPAYRGSLKTLAFDGILYDFLKKATPDESKHKNAEGQNLNQPKAADLRKLYRQTGRKLPKGTGTNGAIVISDMMEDLGDLAWSVAEVSKQQPTELFHRQPVYRDEADRQNVIRRIYIDAQEIGKMRAGEMPIKKSPDTFICIGCPFRDPCELHETGADYGAYFRAAFQPHDTYSTYAIDWDEKG
jgi:RecB family exonuclease